MNVTLLTHTQADPMELTTFAAKICYSQDLPEMGNVMNVDGQLFQSGHHSTLEHWSASFVIDGLAVADVDFGSHLTTPFYVTDQQSGRFCLGMYANPDYEVLGGYLDQIYPGLSAEARQEALDYVRRQMETYNRYLPAAEALAVETIMVERPKASDKYIAENAPKFAQEQMRMLIPLVFPTRFVYTVNLVVLAAQYKAAWNPGLRLVTQMMVDALLAKFPGLDFMFATRLDLEWAPSVSWTGEPLLYKPGYELLRLDPYPEAAPPTQDDKHPIDLMRMDPRFMDIAASSIRERISVSCAAYGQVQRSRTFRRGVPVFTGGLYVPPLLAKLGIEAEMLESRTRWADFSGKVPPMLFASLAPYGAMLAFGQEADLTAVTHEAGERTCWCAQEEFFHLNCRRRAQIQSTQPDHPLLDVLSPRCFGTLACDQGKRYCGRDIKLQNAPDGDYFHERVV